MPLFTRPPPEAGKHWSKQWTTLPTPSETIARRDPAVYVAPGEIFGSRDFSSHFDQGRKGAGKGIHVASERRASTQIRATIASDVRNDEIMEGNGAAMSLGRPPYKTVKPKSLVEKYREVQLALEDSREENEGLEKELKRAREREEQMSKQHQEQVAELENTVRNLTEDLTDARERLGTLASELSKCITVATERSARAKRK